VAREDLPHRPGRDREEVGAALGRHALAGHEPQVHLVDERRRLQRVPGRLAAHHGRRQRVQLVPQDLDQASAGLSVARFVQQPRDLPRSPVLHRAIIDGPGGPDGRFSTSSAIRIQVRFSCLRCKKPGYPDGSGEDRRIEPGSVLLNSARHRVRLVSWPALAAVLVWGASFPAVRVALASFHPFGLVTVRLALGAAVLAAASWLRGAPVLPRRGDRVPSILLGAILGLHVDVQSFAMGLTASIQAGWIVAFIPVLIALGGRVFLAQHLSARAWAGVVLATLGVLLVASASPPDLANAGLGDLLMLGSCFTWAAYCLLAPGPIARSGAIPVTTLATLVALGLGLPGALWSGFLVQPWTPLTLATAIFLGTVCSGVALVWWNRGVHQDGPARAGVTLYLQPFVTLAAAMAFLGERSTWQALVGGPVVLVGVWLTASVRSRSNSLPPRRPTPPDRFAGTLRVGKRVREAIRRCRAPRR